MYFMISKVGKRFTMSICLFNCGHLLQIKIFHLLDYLLNL
nr:MAG TPA: hypothetical protein [Caudoviricetes sp.]